MLAIRDDEHGGALIPIKAVPGARQSEVVGPLGDRLKVRIAAPAEAGQANAAIVALIARELGVRERDVEIVQGHTDAHKVVRVRGVGAADVRARWPG